MLSDARMVIACGVAGEPMKKEKKMLITFKERYVFGQRPFNVLCFLAG